MVEKISRSEQKRRYKQIEDVAKELVVWDRVVEPNRDNYAK
jgi:hypothetical protein